jgi:hypothetical protein
MNSMRRSIAVLAVVLLAGTACQNAEDPKTAAKTSDAITLQSAGGAVVTNGAFTNLYVFKASFPGETWDQHIAGLRPTISDEASFSRVSIDAVSDFMMDGQWPTYWDPAWQYNSIAPPQFFGSGFATDSCVNDMMNDLDNGVVDFRTAGTLANCHQSGLDPSPQIVLVFSPDIKLAKPTSDGMDMCTTSTTNAYHSWGFNIPNYATVPTSESCMGAAGGFDAFTTALSHEEIEMVTDPAGFGFGDLGTWAAEAGDLCESGGPANDPTTLWGPHGTDSLGRIDSLQRYWSDEDNNCQPRLDAPASSQSATWVLGTGSPLHQFSSGPDTTPFSVPAPRVTTTALATQVLLVIQTGGDDLHGSSSADATLNFIGGSLTTTGISMGNHWNNGETHSAVLTLPGPGVRVSDITGVTLSTNNSGDDWKVDKIGLIVSFDGSVTPTVPPHPIVHRWLDASELPLKRFTSSDGTLSLTVPAMDVGVGVTALSLVISVGNDNLNGGSNNCDVSFTSTPAIAPLPNVNAGATWDGWTIHTIPVAVPAGLVGGDVTGVTLSTNLSGDDWNVERVQLFATIDPVALIHITISSPAAMQYDHSASLTLDYSATDVGGPGIATVVGSIDGSTTVGGHPIASGLTVALLTDLALGTHTFSVVATDAWGNSQTSAPVTFEIIATSSSIMADVNQMVGDGQISGNRATSLLAKLNAAAAARARGDCATAASIYEAFIHEVNAQTGRSIDPAAAAILIADAQYLIAHCP